MFSIRSEEFHIRIPHLLQHGEFGIRIEDLPMVIIS